MTDRDAYPSAPSWRDATPEADALIEYARLGVKAVLIHPSLGLKGLREQQLTRAIRIVESGAHPRPARVRCEPGR